MNFKEFLVLLFCTVSLGLVALSSVNYYIDEFGLFGDCGARQIWGKEKRTKLLLASGCKLEGYDTFIFGSSSSSLNFSSAEFKNGKVYNLSMNAGVASESKLAFSNLLESDKAINNIIIGLIPSYTGDKALEIKNMSNLQVLTSTLSIEMFLRRLFGFFSEPVFKGSWRGDTDSSFLGTAKKSNEIIHGEIELLSQNGINNYFSISEIQVANLKDMVVMAEKNSVRVFFYFYEYPSAYSTIPNFIDKYKAYKAQLRTSLEHVSGDLVSFIELTDWESANENYFNGHHLSRDGSKELVKLIDAQLK